MTAGVEVATPNPAHPDQPQNEHTATKQKRPNPAHAKYVKLYRWFVDYHSLDRTCLTQPELHADGIEIILPMGRPPREDERLAQVEEKEEERLEREAEEDRKVGKKRNKSTPPIYLSFHNDVLAAAKEAVKVNRSLLEEAMSATDGAESIRLRGEYNQAIMAAANEAARKALDPYYSPNLKEARRFMNNLIYKDCKRPEKWGTPRNLEEAFVFRMFDANSIICPSENETFRSFRCRFVRMEREGFQPQKTSKTEKAKAGKKTEKAAKPRKKAAKKKKTKGTTKKTTKKMAKPKRGTRGKDEAHPSQLQAGDYSLGQFRKEVLRELEHVGHAINHPKVGYNRVFRARYTSAKAGSSKRGVRFSETTNLKHLRLLTILGYKITAYEHEMSSSVGMAPAKKKYKSQAFLDMHAAYFGADAPVAHTRNSEHMLARRVTTIDLDTRLNLGDMSDAEIGAVMQRVALRMVGPDMAKHLFSIVMTSQGKFHLKFYNQPISPGFTQWQLAQGWHRDGKRIATLAEADSSAVHMDPSLYLDYLALQRMVVEHTGGDTCMLDDTREAAVPFTINPKDRTITRVVWRNESASHMSIMQMERLIDRAKSGLIPLSSYHDALAAEAPDLLAKQNSDCRKTLRGLTQPLTFDEAKTLVGTPLSVTRAVNLRAAVENEVGVVSRAVSGARAGNDVVKSRRLGKAAPRASIADALAALAAQGSRQSTPTVQTLLSACFFPGTATRNYDLRGKTNRMLLALNTFVMTHMGVDVSTEEGLQRAWTLVLDFLSDCSSGEIDADREDKIYGQPDSRIYEHYTAIAGSEKNLAFSRALAEKSQRRRTFLAPVAASPLPPARTVEDLLALRRTLVEVEKDDPNTPPALPSPGDIYQAAVAKLLPGVERERQLRPEGKAFYQKPSFLGDPSRGMPSQADLVIRAVSEQAAFAFERIPLVHPDATLDGGISKVKGRPDFRYDMALCTPCRDFPGLDLKEESDGAVLSLDFCVDARRMEMAVGNHRASATLKEVTRLGVFSTQGTFVRSNLSASIARKKHQGPIKAAEGEPSDPFQFSALPSRGLSQVRTLRLSIPELLAVPRLVGSLSRAVFEHLVRLVRQSPGLLQQGGFAETKPSTFSQVSDSTLSLVETEGLSHFLGLFLSFPWLPHALVGASASTSLDAISCLPKGAQRELQRCISRYGARSFRLAALAAAPAQGRQGHPSFGSPHFPPTGALKPSLPMGLLLGLAAEAAIVNGSVSSGTAVANARRSILRRLNKEVFGEQGPDPLVNDRRYTRGLLAALAERKRRLDLAIATCLVPKDVPLAA